jgi:hypothetical protein
VTTPPAQPASARLPTVRPSHQLPAGVRPADRRGLTAAGGALLLLALSGAGAAYDLLTGSTLDLGFALSFLAGCLLTALLVHREDLLAAVVMPPLAYVTVVFFAGVVDPPAGSGPMLLRQGVVVLNEVVLDAPILFGGTGAAVLLAGARWAGSRG